MLYNSMVSLLLPIITSPNCLVSPGLFTLYIYVRTRYVKTRNQSRVSGKKRDSIAENRCDSEENERKPFRGCSERSGSVHEARSMR